MDDMSFFHQATVQICGTLDIDDAVKNCFLFLKQHIPLELMELTILDTETGRVQVISKYSLLKDLQNIDVPLPLSLEAMEYIKENKNGDKIFFINTSLEKALAKKRMSTEMVIDQVVGAGLPLHIDGDVPGMLLVLARGSRSFETSHVRLLSLLHDPFAMAVSNHLQYREFVKIRNLLFNDNRYLHEVLRKADDTLYKADGTLQKPHSILERDEHLNKSEHLNLDDVVRKHIHKVVGMAHGKIQGKDGAAALLGVHPSTLRHRMRKLRIPFGRNVSSA